MKRKIKIFGFFSVLLIALALIYSFKPIYRVVPDHYRTCNVCNGSGKCIICFGTGRLRCTTCGGTGSTPNISGAIMNIYNAATGQNEQSAPATITCTTCNGSGTIPCNICNASGECVKCRGTGQIPG